MRAAQALRPESCRATSRPSRQCRGVLLRPPEARHPALQWWRLFKPTSAVATCLRASRRLDGGGRGRRKYSCIGIARSPRVAEVSRMPRTHHAEARRAGASRPASRALKAHRHHCSWWRNGRRGWRRKQGINDGTGVSV